MNAGKLQHALKRRVIARKEGAIGEGRQSHRKDGASEALTTKPRGPDPGPPENHSPLTTPASPPPSGGVFSCQPQLLRRKFPFPAYIYRGDFTIHKTEITISSKDHAETTGTGGDDYQFSRI